jgi:hypothetical protein
MGVAFWDEGRPLCQSAFAEYLPAKCPADRAGIPHSVWPLASVTSTPQGRLS